MREPEVQRCCCNNTVNNIYRCVKFLRLLRLQYHGILHCFSTLNMFAQYGTTMMRNRKTFTPKNKVYMHHITTRAITDGELRLNLSIAIAYSSQLVGYMVLNIPTPVSNRPVSGFLSCVKVQIPPDFMQSLQVTISTAKEKVRLLSNQPAFLIFSSFRTAYE